MYPANWWPRVYAYWPVNYWPDAAPPASLGEGLATAAVTAQVPGATTTARQPGATVEVHP